MALAEGGETYPSRADVTVTCSGDTRRMRGAETQIWGVEGGGARMSQTLESREPRPSNATTYAAPRGPEGTRRGEIRTMLGLAGETQLIPDGPPTLVLQSICLTPSAVFVQGASPARQSGKLSTRLLMGAAAQQLYNNRRLPHKSLNLQVVVFIQ